MARAEMVELNIRLGPKINSWDRSVGTQMLGPKNVFSGPKLLEPNINTWDRDSGTEH